MKARNKTQMLARHSDYIQAIFLKINIAIGIVSCRSQKENKLHLLRSNFMFSGCRAFHSSHYKDYMLACKNSMRKCA